jgi:hypothetical protein
MAIKYSGEGVRDTDGNILVGVENGQVTGACAVGGRRNRIINGAMQVAQRGTSTTGVTTSGYHAVDRYKNQIGSLGTWTIAQTTDAPAGFANSFKMTCTTADASPAAGDYCMINYLIEAQDLQQLDYGSSSAKTVTISFWVKSNKTGSSQLTLMQNDNSNKMYVAPYTIVSADTWEQKTVTISGDTAGLINNDSGSGLQVEWFINGGTDYTSGSADSTWEAYTAADRNSNNLGVGGATSDYFAITGVQLEVGSVATPFEHRSYGEELALCQRYFQPVGMGSAGRCSSTTGTEFSCQFRVLMRANATLTYGGFTGAATQLDAFGTGGTRTITSFSSPISWNNGAYFTTTVSSGLTTGAPAFLIRGDIAAADAEL